MLVTYFKDGQTETLNTSSSVVISCWFALNWLFRSQHCLFLCMYQKWRYRHYGLLLVQAFFMCERDFSSVIRCLTPNRLCCISRSIQSSHSFCLHVSEVLDLGTPFQGAFFHLLYNGGIAAFVLTINVL